MALRRPSLSLLIAIACGLALLLWLAFGDLQRFRAEAPDGPSPVADPFPRVEVVESQQRPYQSSVVAQGQLTPWHEVELRARASGEVESLAVQVGQDLEAGDSLLSLSQEDLPAQLKRAESELELARAELSGAEQLRQRDLISRTEQLRLASAVAQAVAEVESLRQTMAHTRPQAPFAGRLDRLDVEAGDVLQSGEAYGLLIQDRVLKARAFVSQRDALGLAPGLDVTVTLLDGSQLDGELTHVANRADSSTRTFTVEARIDNAERRRLGGASATLNIALDTRNAHRISPALLVLDEDGELGVKVLDEEDRVEFQRINLLSADSRQAWISGLPERVRLITLGGGFVEVGDRVEAVPAEAEPGADGDTAPLGEGNLTLSGTGDEER